MKKCMQNFIKYFICALLIFTAQLCHAQTVEMADAFRSEGKIYVVITMILIVLFGFIGYLFLTDRKLSKLEKIIHDKKQTK